MLFVVLEVCPRLIGNIPTVYSEDVKLLMSTRKGNPKATQISVI